MRIFNTPRSANFVARAGAAALLASLTLGPVAAQAELTQANITQVEGQDANREYRSKTVFYGDLDLDSEAGQQTLQRRIKAAARKLCSPAPQTSWSEYADYRQCMESAQNVETKIALAAR